jgi:hypothetical protein
MNKDIYKGLSLINVQLIKLCQWLNEKRDFATASRLLPIIDNLMVLVAESDVKLTVHGLLKDIAVDSTFLRLRLTG